jgi:hypothetical protein
VDYSFFKCFGGKCLKKCGCLFFFMNKALLLLLLLLFSGCVSQDVNLVDFVSEGCVRSCQQFNGDKSDGPCLTDELYPDWVCDIAHSPREDVDNLPENQCDKYKEGVAHHFVEVTPDCVLIRAQ